MATMLAHLNYHAYIVVSTLVGGLTPGSNLLFLCSERLAFVGYTIITA